MRTVNLQPDSIQTVDPPLRPNDEVTVSLRTGEQQTILVTSVSADWIEGRLSGSVSVVRVSLADVTHLQRKELDGPRTTLFVIAIFGAIFILPLFVPPELLAAFIMLATWASAAA